jgi:hypothetical protein
MTRFFKIIIIEVIHANQASKLRQVHINFETKVYHRQEKRILDV